MKFRRLHLQIYLWFLAVAVLCVVVTASAATVFHGAWESRDVPRPFAAGVTLLGDSLRPGHEHEDLENAARRLGIEAALYSSDGALLATTDPSIAAPDLDAADACWAHARRAWGIQAPLSDGRWLTVVHRHRPVGPRLGGVLALVLVVTAVGTLPLARRLTGRLMRLQEAVERIGEGQLSERVPVQGKDEIAALAASFNRAAERIEALVAGQRKMLASASHELRSPLARVRLAIELLGEGTGDAPALVAQAQADIAELDALVEDLLLASRLRSMPALAREPVDLGALCRDEAARVGAVVAGDGETVGDPRLVRRAVRNLLENARRHGGVHVELVVVPGEVRVLDRGPGVAEADRERIFEAFYGSGSREGGLGLSLVRDIARAHGGDARWEPRAGGGSVFVVGFAVTP